MPEEPGTAQEGVPDTAEEPTVVTIPEAAPSPDVEAADEDVAGPSRAPHVAGPPRAPHMAPPERRRALLPWAVALGVIVFLGAVAVGLTYTPLFHAKTITVKGERRLSEQRILQLAGIGPGTDVFHLDVRGAERRLERSPWVATAVVTKRLPSTVSVTVAERRPAGLIRSPDGRLRYVAGDGTVLGRASDMAQMPQIQTTDPSQVAAGAAVAAGLPSSFAPLVASIGVGSDGSVLLVMRSGVTATYGDASQAAAKGEALKAVMEYAANQGKTLVSVDVEVPGAPTAVFAGTVEPSPNPRS